MLNKPFKTKTLFVSASAGIGIEVPNQALTVNGNISSNNIIYANDGNSDQWNSAFNTATTYQNTSATFLTPSIAESIYAKLSSNAFTYDPSVSSIDTVNGINIASGIFSGVLGGNHNTASGRYSTVVGGFSSCATGFSTFLGAGSGSCATGDYAIIVGGLRNTASGCYNTVGGGRLNSASGPGGVAGTDNTIAGGCANRVFAKCQTIGGGAQNCIGPGGAQSTISGGYQNNISSAQSTIVGGIRNNISGTGSFTGGSNNTISGNFSNIGGGCCNTVSGNSSNINGGLCQTVNGVFSTINGGLGNFNPLRGSIIGGGAANHTGGFNPNNITAAASISGNGTCTALIQTGIGSCFSASNTTGAVSLYYATATNPLSSGTFVTANVVTNAANCIIINGDYSTCTVSGLSATNIWVYDRCLNQTGIFNFVGGGVLNTVSGCYNFIGSGQSNFVSGNNGNVIVGGGSNCIPVNFGNMIGAGFGNRVCGGQSSIVGGNINTISSTGFYSFIAGGRQNTISNWYSSVIGGSFNSINGQNSIVGGQGNNINSSNAAIVAGRCNTNNSNGAFIGAGSFNTTSGNDSTIVGGRFNYNPLFNSDIHGGAFNHTGGFRPWSVTSSGLSGNGSCTCINTGNGGFCSQFSPAGTAGAVSIIWTTAATGPSLSAANYGIVNIGPSSGNANAIIVSGCDFSSCTSSGLSATNVWLYDRCLNNSNCNTFIGGGILNTASGNYSSVLGGIFNHALGTCSVVGGGFLNSAGSIGTVVAGGVCNCTGNIWAVVAGGNSNCANNNGGVVSGGRSNTNSGFYSIIGGGICNVVTGTCSTIVGGRCNNVTGIYSTIAGGNVNTASSSYSTIIGGNNNIASGIYSFIAGGSANDTRGFANTFILGTALSATRSNATFVNNLALIGIGCVITGVDGSNPVCLTNSGLYRQGNNLSIQTFGFRCGEALQSSTGLIGFASNSTFWGGSTNRAALTLDSNGIISQRDGNVSQGNRIYNTFTNTNNFERGALTFSAPNSAFTISTESSGTGLNRDIWFNTAGSTKMVITSGGNIGIGTTTPNSRLTVVGDISATSDFTTNGKIYIQGDGNSDQWNQAYNNSTAYAINSSSFATYDYVNNGFLPLSGGIISGATRINSDLTVFGNLTATGTTTFANTVFSVTSALSVVHVGTGPALWVGNNGSGDIASFYDIDQNIEILHVGGNNGSFPNVGVKTSTPNVDFTVNGQISSNNTIWSDGGNSNNWNSVYSNVNSNSATWDTGGGSAYFIVSANFNAIVNRQYLVDTTSSSVVGTLPLSPDIGDNISFIDSNNTWETNPLILNNNGNLLQTFNEHLTANISGYQFKIVYIGGSYGWKIV